jgi:hypothetical protein
MAFEEVGFPALFERKKTYVLRAHESPEKIHWGATDDYMSRGLQAKKRTASGLLRAVTERAVLRVLDPTNLWSPREIVTEIVQWFFTRDWPEADFIRTAKYKPHKQNMGVRYFVERMMAEDPEYVPVPDEPFEYIIVNRPAYRRDARGCKQELRSSDLWERPGRADKLGLTPNLFEYFTSQVRGGLAPFAIGRAIGEPSDVADDTEDDDSAAEAAKRWVSRLAAPYEAQIDDGGGRQHKAAFTAVWRDVCTEINAMHTHMRVLRLGVGRIKGDPKHTRQLLDMWAERFPVPIASRAVPMMGDMASALFAAARKMEDTCAAVAADVAAALTPCLVGRDAALAHIGEDDAADRIVAALIPTGDTPDILVAARAYVVLRATARRIRAYAECLAAGL